jgi:hypothetical protein
MNSSAVSDLGKSLFFLGLAVALVGLVIWTGIGRSWFGRLPGDIHVRRGGAEFYFPLATCILISAVLTLLSWLFRNRH